MTEANHDDVMTALRRAGSSLIEGSTIRDVDAVLDRLVRSAVEVIPGVEGGGVSRTEGNKVESSHATDPDVHDLDQLQSRLAEGPCITAATDPPETGIVLAHDLAGDDGRRWPDFAPAAVRAGFRSLMSVGLSTAGKRRTALNLYAHDPGVFDAPAQLSAGIFGLQAAMVLHGADNVAHLGYALESRDIIGQAKGILMERFTVDDDEAFQMLVRSSQDTNIKLVDVARWLIREAIARRAQQRGPSEV